MTEFLKHEQRCSTHSISLPKETRDKIIELAEKENRSFSYVIRTILNIYLKGHDSLDTLTF